MTALKITSAVSASIEDGDAIGLAMVWPGPCKSDPLEGTEQEPTVANKFIVADKPGSRKVGEWKRTGKGRND